VHIGIEGSEVTVAGFNVWAHQWKAIGETIEAPHPSYPSQRHLLEVWTIQSDSGHARFAAGEVSNGVWCFYEPNRRR
jgi:hypothetical protein